MEYFALIYHVVDNYIERRAPYREEHLRLARESNERGEMILAGAFDDPADGALLIFRAADKSAVEQFVRHDPYVANGLITGWEIRRWRVVIGDLQ